MAERPDDADVGVRYCYRHPDRETGLSCTQCGRPICGECMRPVSVGQLCPDDAKEGEREVRKLRVTPAAERPPRVTYSLLGILVAVFLVQYVSVGGSSLTSDYSEYVRGIRDGEYYRLFTSMFLHSTALPIHILFNGYALYLFGPLLERALGPWRFLALYLVAGLLGSAVFFAVSPDSADAVGASGAIFGLLGGFLALAYNRRNTRIGRTQYQQALGLVVINLAFGFIVPNIAWQAHAGGLVGGIAIALAYDSDALRRLPTAVRAIVGPAVVLAVAVALVALRMGSASPLV